MSGIIFNPIAAKSNVPWIRTSGRKSTKANRLKYTVKTSDAASITALISAHIAPRMLPLISSIARTAGTKYKTVKI